MKIFLPIIAVILAFNSHSQFSSSNFNSSRNWSLNKHEIFFALGATQFLGDLGGRNQVGTQKSLADIDFVSTRMGGGIGYRFRFHPMWATSTQLYFGYLRGDDSNTDEIIRRSRNLSFRSPILELSQRLECILLAKEKVGARYRIKGLKGMRPKADVLYIFSGISGFYFNPQTQIDGSWTDLRPLRTEGQGLPGGVDEYGKFNLAIPFGVGFKLGIGNFWRIGMEFSYNKSFTDYLDDVSTNYYDPSILATEVGPEAVYAANPAIENHSWFVAGQQRGNPNDKDAYFFANITLVRNITYPKSRGGGRIKWSGRTKF
ncbi:MAG: hypothetical protein R3277_09615 [Brumimicrobium sp.]|nr:hypothetical protein [Brumimicrobium sp.]